MSGIINNYNNIINLLENRKYDILKLIRESFDSILNNINNNSSEHNILNNNIDYVCKNRISLFNNFFDSTVLLNNLDKRVFNINNPYLNIQNLQLCNLLLLDKNVYIYDNDSSEFVDHLNLYDLRVLFGINYNNIKIMFDNYFNITLYIFNQKKQIERSYYLMKNKVKFPIFCFYCALGNLDIEKFIDNNHEFKKLCDKLSNNNLNDIDVKSNIKKFLSEKVLEPTNTRNLAGLYYYVQNYQTFYNNLVELRSLFEYMVKKFDEDKFIKLNNKILNLELNLDKEINKKIKLDNELVELNNKNYSISKKNKLLNKKFISSNKWKRFYFLLMFIFMSLSLFLLYKNPQYNSRINEYINDFNNYLLTLNVNVDNYNEFYDMDL